LMGTIRAPDTLVVGAPSPFCAQLPIDY